jgi:hypothetical protein
VGQPRCKAEPRASVRFNQYGAYRSSDYDGGVVIVAAQPGVARFTPSRFYHGSFCRAKKFSIQGSSPTVMEGFVTQADCYSAAES